VLQRSDGNHVYAREFLGQIEAYASDPTTVAMGLAALQTAVDTDADKQDFILQGYLTGLTKKGHAAEAVNKYRGWSKAGLVPPLGASPRWRMHRHHATRWCA
jgi:hypothetical protein